MPVPGGPPPTHGVQDATPMGGPTAELQAANAAQEAAADGPRDISELLAPALDAYRREAAGSEGATQTAPGCEADVGELIAQALGAVAPRTGEANEEPSERADSGGQDTGRGVQEPQAQAMGSGVVEPSGERAKVEGVEDWMWEWRDWREVAPGEPCPAGLVYSTDLHAGTSCARLPDNLRARLDAVEAARGGGADERPLAPFPPRPDTPLAVIAAGDEAEEEQEAEDKGDKQAYGPGESALALMFEDDAEPDVYAGMDVYPANVPLLPMPTAVPPPPLGSCEQRHCRFHAAEGADRHSLAGNQVLRPFPTPGSGTLWVVGESLRDRRVSCLSRWTVCPTRSPSQDTNHSTCRGECSWSGPLVPPPGRCHLGPVTNGPGRIPPCCVCSGGADTGTGGGPKLLGLGPLPASLLGSFRPAPPLPLCWPLPPRFLPWGFPLPAPLSALPGSCRAVLAPCFLPPPFPAPALCLSVAGPGAGCLAPPLHAARLSLLPCGHPCVPPHFPIPFPRRLRSLPEGVGVRGEGAPLLPFLRSMHAASTMQARGAAPVCAGGVSSFLGLPARFGSSLSPSVGGGG